MISQNNSALDHYTILSYNHNHLILFLVPRLNTH